MYPTVRLRRNRKTRWLRELVAENRLSVNDLVLALFVVEGENQRQEISTMPGIYRLSIDQVVLTARQAYENGINAIILFPCIEAKLKSDNADEAYNLDNLMCRTIRSIKKANIDIGVICDVALDPYTTHGHDGILHNGDVDNDKTVEALCKQALVLAKAGVGIVAPSDMMDGRIMAIRQMLDSEGFINVNILSYAAKYASNFYSPFRDAVSSNKAVYLDKATYQMDVRNSREAMLEIEHDLAEGADMIMIKPGMMFLDIIAQAANSFNTNIFAYQVSGEYAMLRLAAEVNALNWQAALIESLLCFKRAGASNIVTYAALEVAQILNKQAINIVE
ncbi:MULTISPECIES: porphobilinogen synthase [Rickettsieae]|jgi:porphobilinogen synthase|uniref:porphobilinogen synthase n=1 Tax=Rickettsieae TaxID=33988 RepID=UPI000B9B538E|nr:porphobilinogen synthase [Rickettsia endosymbiont of Culicoides newsteadi]OZG31540.1 porphobilinogen synthase [Rickettsia endosymbiont of Culicoides newsteadi]HJD56630.1 porphobilinogen synthase [Rickettsia endosymbiont of Sericostoma sp. HW-2014]